MSRKTSPRTGSSETKRKRMTSAEIERQVRAVLVELLSESESDSVRVSAAKALADRLDKGNKKKDGAKEDELRQQAEEHQKAIEEAAILLEQIADEKFDRAAGKGCVDQKSKGGTAEA